MRVLGVMNAYNEADCIGTAVCSMVEAGVDMHVFDHGSTDNTADVLAPLIKRQEIRYHYVDRTEVPAMVGPKQSSAIWDHVAAFVRSQISEYDWVVWQAADELVRQPDGELITVEAIEREAARGIQVIRPLIRNFQMTRQDGKDGHLARRLKRFRPGPTGHAPRAWEIGLTPNPMIIGQHVQDPAITPKLHGFYGLWPVGTVVSNNEWLLDHYPLRSEEQALRKVMKERNWIGPTNSPRYGPLRQRLLAAQKSQIKMHLRLCVNKQLVLEDRDLPLPGVNGCG